MSLQRKCVPTKSHYGESQKDVLLKENVKIRKIAKQNTSKKDSVTLIFISYWVI